MTDIEVIEHVIPINISRYCDIYDDLLSYSDTGVKQVNY